MRAQAEQLAAARGIQLPNDFFTAAAAGGLYKSVLERYANLQVLTCDTSVRQSYARPGFGQSLALYPTM